MFVKIAIGVMALLALVYFSPVLMHMQNGTQISGSSNEQVQKSAMKVRRTLPTEDRHAFDIAFGLLREIKSSEGENAFAEAVGGKSTDEVVELARKEVAMKIAAGDPKFKEFKSWDDMLSKEAALDAPKKSAAALAAPLRNSERPGRGGE
ncbi:MAG: hypothetical protein ACKN9T_03815 [Candidatus Methylumidiphilus sp.]